MKLAPEWWGLLGYFLLQGLVEIDATAMKRTMSDRTDTMGHYVVHNRFQCQRLCWYRRLCKAYSYNSRLADELNCVLHAYSVAETSVPDDWKSWKASMLGINNACASRHCADAEVCVPSGTQWKCLPLPANCGEPELLRGFLKWNGTQQGDIATLICKSGFGLNLDVSSNRMVCYVTSRWTPLNVTCLPMEVSSAAMPRCRNDGLETEEGCNCSLPFTGDNCERYFRDCTEVYESGYSDDSLSGPLLIKPHTALKPFLVKCALKSGGVTTVMERQRPFNSSSSQFDVNWNQVKEGIMAELKSNFNCKNYFIGLDNLHHLTSQSVYKMHLNLSRKGNSSDQSYDRFSVGPESSKYNLSYIWSESNKPGTEDGFASGGSLVFLTKDRGTEKSCVTSDKGAAGWYDQNCTQYTLFDDRDLIWPQDGVDYSWDNLEMTLERQT